MKNTEDRLLIGEMYEIKSMIYISEINHNGRYDLDRKLETIEYYPEEKFVVVDKKVDKKWNDAYFICYAISKDIFFPIYTSTILYRRNFNHMIKHLKSKF